MLSFSACLRGYYLNIFWWIGVEQIICNDITTILFTPSAHNDLTIIIWVRMTHACCVSSVEFMLIYELYDYITQNTIS